MKALYSLLLTCFLILPVFSESVIGFVKSVDKQNETLIIQLEDSDTGDLSVRVSPGDLEVGYVNKRIRGELSNSDGTIWLNRIWPLDLEQEEMRKINQVLHADTAVRKRQQFRKEGDVGINFAMINEQGQFVQFDQLKGNWVIMNFIFTRCRMPEMCPAQSARMVSLQKKAAEAGISNLHQLSITFDPEYDTPGILNEYARVKGADSRSFSFLTGSHECMLDLLKQYGVVAFESENIIDHTVTTLLFDKSGKIVLRRNGTRWKEKDFIKKILKTETK